MIGIVGGFKLDKHQINCTVGTHQIDDFHNRVINRDKRQNQIKVASAEYQSKQNLTLSRQT